MSTRFFSPFGGVAPNTLSLSDKPGVFTFAQEVPETLRQAPKARDEYFCAGGHHQGEGNLCAVIFPEPWATLASMASEGYAAAHGSAVYSRTQAMDPPGFCTPIQSGYDKSPPSAARILHQKTAVHIRYTEYAQAQWMRPIFWASTLAVEIICATTPKNGVRTQEQPPGGVCAKHFPTFQRN